MCGLVGIIAKHKSGFSNKDADTFQQMLYADAIRGWDATGVFGITKLGNVEIKKQASAAGHFVTTPQYKKFGERIFQEYQMVIGHNRKATHGEKKHADSHPFWDEEENICLVHNGMISNYKEFCKESTVDSAAIANALATDTIDEVIGNITGAFAFIWYNVDEKKMYMIRNVQRPLYVLETASTFLLASEDSLAYWIAKRNGAYITKCTDLTPMTLYSLSLDDRVLKEERTIEVKKKIYLTTITTTQQTGYGITVRRPLVDTEKNYFLTGSDIRTKDDFLDKVKRDSRIMFKVDSYNVVGTNAYNMTCQMLNVDKSFLKFIMYANKVTFDALNIADALSGRISNIVDRGDYLTIYLMDPEEHNTTTTLNDYDIADDMWMDDRFSAYCDICHSNVKWAMLAQSEVLIDNQEVILVCPKCTGTHRHV